MDIWQAVLLCGVGVAAGWLNVMAGGGSLLSVPTMLFLGLPGPVANGTNRVAILAQNVVAVAAFRRSGYADFRLSLTLGAAAVPGAVAGALVGTKLEGEWFERVLALVMIGVMILMATRRRQVARTAAVPLTRGRLIAGHLAMVGAGFWGGFIQIGVGFVLMPILHRILGLDLVRVNMHKVFIVMVFTVVALTVFASRVDLAWWMGVALALGNAAGGWLGAHTTVTRGERWIRPVFFTVLTVFVVKLLFF